MIRRDDGLGKIQAVARFPQQTPAAVAVHHIILAFQANAGHDGAFIGVQPVHPGQHVLNIFAGGREGEGAVIDPACHRAVNRLALIRKRRHGFILPGPLNGHYSGGQRREEGAVAVDALGVGYPAQVVHGGEGVAVHQPFRQPGVGPGKEVIKAVLKGHEFNSIIRNEEVEVIGDQTKGVRHILQVIRADEAERNLILLTVAVGVLGFKGAQHLVKLLDCFWHVQLERIQPLPVDPQDVLPAVFGDIRQCGNAAIRKRHRAFDLRLGLHELIEIGRVLLKIGRQVNQDTFLMQISRLMRA